MDTTAIPDLEAVLKALANRNRLLLLRLLQEPHRVSDMVVRASSASAWGGASRPLTRQTVQGHLRRLMEIGAVVRLGEGKEAVYSVHHPTLFDITEQLRELASVRAHVDLDDATIPAEGTGTGKAPEGPHFVTVRGLHEGAIHALPETPPAEGWTIGRSRDCHVCLDHDRFVSGLHASVHQTGGEHVLVDARTNRNGTRFNFERLPPGGMVPMVTGDMVEVGRSLLLFRAGRR
ncbi:MAG: FHA domain-containing protein [Thermoplasmatota archaeon]